METRRNESAPAWLVAFAALALVGSVLATRPWRKPAEDTRLEPPRRTVAPLRFALDALEPIEPAELTTLSTDTFAVATPVLRVSAPARLAPGEDPLAWCLEDLPRATAAVPPKRVTPRLVVLLPSKPGWSAGRQRAMVVTRSTRERWSIAGFDSLAAARRFGAKLANPIAAVSGWLPERQHSEVAQVRGPRLTPASFRPSVVPRTTKPEPVRPATRTIAEYVAIGFASRPDSTPVALAEQLDRVAESREAAPWAWAVAYRLRRIGGASVADPAEVARLSRAADEAFELADRAGGAAAAELRRAGHGLRRRVATWNAGREVELADAARRAAARWAFRGSDGLRYPPSVAAGLTERIERYEQTPDARAARRLATDVVRLAAAADPASIALARSLEQGYRNANVRVAIAGELVERLLPAPDAVTAPVRDRIAGSTVRGRSVTSTQLGVALIPDPSAWRIGLEARGVVRSQTVSRGGPARLFSRGQTSFVAQKQLVVDRLGVKASPSVARANGSPRLVGMSTDYDAVPLLGSYVRSTAQREYGRRRGMAGAEMRRKLEVRVRTELDTRIAESTAKVRQRFDEEVKSRCDALGLDVTPIEMRTTDRRLIGRVRIAGERQLGAHTPRMRAPSDSLLSVQLHESTINNALEGLAIGGERMTPDELRGRVSERVRFELPAREEGERVTLRFADEEALRVAFIDGRARLTMSFAEMSVRGRRHRNFKVHAFYRPEVRGLTAELVSDGSPQIEGRLRSGARMHLHGVLSKVFSEERRVPLVALGESTPERLSAALTGLATNQLVIEDGWLGVAIGSPRPSRVAVAVGGYAR